MFRIKLTDVDIRIPVFDANSRSLRADFVTAISQKRVLPGLNALTVVDVLKKVNLEAADGDAIGIIGKNGAGKTSLLRLISKIYYPTSGNAEINGRVRSLLSLGAGLELSLTGRENVKRLLYLSGESKLYDEAMEAEIIEFSGLKDAIDLPVRTYSAGMTMRLMFSTLVSNTPDIFVPTNFFQQAIGV